MRAKAQPQKAKEKNNYALQVKDFCASKASVEKVKGQPAGWRNICRPRIHKSDNGVFSGKHKELLQLKERYTQTSSQDE